MTDPMPRKDVELPPRMPEAAIIAELRAELSQARADTQAAVALVVERADIDAALDAMEANMRADGQTPLHWREDLPPEDQDKLRACVRAGIAAALADKNGLDLVQALRAEATSREMEWAAISRDRPTAPDGKGDAE
jgi:hypothetical protein